VGIQVDVQYGLSGEGLPGPDEFSRWALAALEGQRQEAELTIRIVDEGESAALNETYRGKPGSTNVLSFPFEPPPGIKLALLGDLAICAPVVQREAAEQHKQVSAHWAHMVVHGVLHLVGYDHASEEQAVVMEALETEILARLGYPNPYQT
jgi:probable rRNA maturation factor